MQDAAIILKPSKLFIGAWIFIVLGSLILILLLPMFPLVKIGLILMLLIYGFFILARYGCLASPKSIIQLYCLPTGLWEIMSHSESRKMRLLPDSTVTRLGCVLKFSAIKPDTTPKKLAVLIMPDAISREHYRRLLVRLHSLRHTIFTQYEF